MAAVVALKELRAAARAEGRSLAAALDEAAEATGYSTAQLYRLNKTYDERVEKYGVASMGRRSGQGRPREFEQDEAAIAEFTKFQRQHGGQLHVQGG